jgi:hypothetical protein
MQIWLHDRRVKHHDERTSPRSTTPLTSLTPPELKLRGERLRIQRRSTAATIQRLKDRVKSQKKDMDMSKELTNHLYESLEYAQNNPRLMKESIESSLLELLKDEAERDGSSSVDVLLDHKDTKQIVDFFTESMKNHIHKVNGHEGRYRFSPHLMGMSMNLYLQSGPSAYKSMRDDNVVVYPSAGTLAHKRQLQKIKVGDCVVMYEKQPLMRETQEEIGELMCDEMKLKENILINVSSNRMVGFTDDFVSKKKILKNLLDEDKIESFCEPATYVNQWRYRAVNGRSFNCEFWFNSGSLDGDALLEQFIQVVLRCELAGSRVLGLVSDAGGNNARLMTILRGNKPIPEGSWLPLDSIRTANPYNPNRCIYLFHCSTHTLKAMRNQLYTSWVDGGAKQFLSEDDVQIGKAIVQECFERDRHREMNMNAPISEVRDSTVHLNKWSKMDVKEALRPFSWKTLCEVSTHLYEELGVSKYEFLSKDNHPIGYMPAVAVHLKSILQKNMPANYDALAPSISSFEWLANVHEIFNMTLMETSMVITFANIDR